MTNDPKAQKFITERIERKNKQKEKKEKKAKEIKSLDGKRIVFKVKVNKKNEAYKAITAKDIAVRLKIDSRKIFIKPIKKIGETKVKINVESVKNEIKIVLEEEK